MTNPFFNSQKKNLRHLLEVNAPTSLFAHLGIDTLHEEKIFDLLYKEFVARVPVFDADSLMNRTARMMSGAETNPALLYARPQLLAKAPVIAFANDDGLISPLTEPELKGFAATERAMLDNLRSRNLIGRKVTVFDVFEPLNTSQDTDTDQPTLPCGPLRQSFMRQNSWLVKESFLPTSEQCEAFQARSRYQHFHGMLELLKEVGEEVDILVARPRTLTYLSLILAQQTRKFTPITELCPNLKVALMWGESVLPYRREISHILSGLSHPVPALDMICHAPGLTAWQDDPNIAHWMQLQDDTGVFYEFIPTDNISPEGKLQHNARRLHAGEVEKGGEYLLLASNTSGFLAFNTGWVIQVMATDPMRIMRLRPAAGLNHFNEALHTNVFDRLLSEINDALATYGFFIRDYMLADNVPEKHPLYVLEVSKPLNDIPQDVLESLANKIHTELSLRNPAYQKAYQMPLQPPHIAFVAMGTFSNQPDGLLPPPIDASPDATLAQEIINRAWEKSIIKAMEDI